MTIFRYFPLLLLPLVTPMFAADDAPAPASAKEMLRARLAEETSAPTPPNTAAPAPKRTSTTAAASASAPSAPGPSGATGAAATAAEKNPLLATTAAPAAQDEPKNQNPTLLPKVEVSRPRITKLDQQLAKEDQDIAREKQNTKPTEADKALNNEKVSHALSIFGGESAKFRQHVSSERVSLMEDEKDIIEAIAHAKTKEEKAELQKQLDALREERRMLEQSLR
ncbi:MAG TPA: hypothetical protein VHE61_07840 [Opitutaceae bacterium]|nr:hypothetical protein [Opitutaceae bacterium]